MDINEDQLKAITIIKNYLNVSNKEKWTDEYVMQNYSVAVNSLVEKAKDSIVCNGIKEKTEGNSTVKFVDNYNAWGITDEIKTLLPLPFIKMFW